MSRFEGRVAVITGGADGIGRATAEALAARGVHIAVLDILEEKAREAADALAASGVRTLAVAADISDRASLADAQKKVTSELGPVSLLFANAGVGIPGGLIGGSERAVDWILGVNVMGPVNTARAFVPAMIEGEGPRHVAFTASTICLLPLEGAQAAYGATKKAMTGLAEGIRVEIAPHGIGVTLVYPCLVNTRIWDAARARPERFGGARHQPEEAGQYWRDGGISPEAVAARAVEAFETGDAHCVVPDGTTLSRFEENAAANRDTLRAAFPA